MKMRSIALLAGLLLSAPALAAPRFGFGNDQAHDVNWQAHQQDMATGGANMIRMGLDSWVVISDCTTSGITWNNSGWAPIDAEVNNAISLGFKISFVLADTHGCAVDFNPTDFNNFTANYVGTIAARYAGKVDNIQLYNEANTNSYQDYSIVLDPSNYPSGYLANEAAALLAAHTAMKAADPNMRLTTNSDDSNATMAEVYVYFDALAPSLDIISEDNYPGYNGAGAANYAVMGQRITDAYNRYGKPVAITEFGDSTTGITATQQGQEIVGSIQAMQGVAGLAFATIYEYLDHSDLCCFGIVDVNNVHKSDYTAVMNAIAAAVASGPGNSVTGVALSNKTFVCGTAGTVGAVTVTGTGNFASSTLSLTGADAGQFTLSSSTLPSNLQVGASPAGCPTSYLLNIVATDTGAAGSPFTQPEIITANGKTFNESCSLVQTVDKSTNIITVTSPTCTP